MLPTQLSLLDATVAKPNGADLMNFLKARQIQLDGRAQDVTSYTQGFAKEAIDIIVSIMKDPAAKDMVRLKAAETILNRAAGPARAIDDKHIDFSAVSDKVLAELALQVLSGKVDNGQLDPPAHDAPPVQAKLAPREDPTGR